MEVQLATAKDAGEIALMSRDYIEEGLGWSWNESRVVHSIKEPETIVAIAKQDKIIIGFSIMHFKQSTAHLDLLAVKPKYRRQGVGKCLVNWLEESAMTAGTFRLSLEVRKTNRVAKEFYKSLGYKQVRIIEGYYRKKEAAIKMCKDISII